MTLLTRARNDIVDNDDVVDNDIVDTRARNDVVDTCA